MSSQVKVLFWYEEETVGFLYDWMNRVCRYYNAEIVVVDVMNHLKGSYAFATFEEALAAHQDFELVYMDHRGEIILDEFNHPDGKVLYLTGQSVEGFGNRKLNGHVVRLRKGEVVLPLQVTSQLLYDRELYISGKRKF